VGDGGGLPQAQVWQSLNPDGSPVLLAVNVSPRQVLHPGLIGLVTRALADSMLDPALLSLEITEQTVTEDTEATARVLGQLRELGIEIALDDFGPGYSSLAHLKHFPVNTIKVDRSFVAGLVTDRSDHSIVAAVISLAHGLGLRAVAEGVESEEQLGDLRLLNCDFAQGFHFSRPRPPEAIESMFAGVEEGSLRPASVA